MTINKNYFIKLVGERSTWLGLVTFLSAFGAVISPESAETIAGIGVSLAGLIFGVTTDE
ncbi:hypothetical protein [Beggiatoa leptomitoformis]|uniref:Holin n=1 Tax=Beggiatoa leptomitoformis TaxID=288004 RepID=A0A650GCS0_9GAMM|nr:hypothetical protein [Beggiatoa leptomitoformis]QGX03665.1 hypothetical protein AL038_18890 [Beggiatoa leptomitoformis]QGX04084.1 hypothetical protein BLE401_18615 [Beggiatoa leptomitoformis]